MQNQAKVPVKGRWRKYRFGLSLGTLLIALVHVTISQMRVVASDVALPPVGHDELNIELNSNGFIPSQVEHQPGTFAIAVENKILEGEYTLRLKAESGTLLQEVKVQKGSVAWTVSLQAGKYTLSEASNSQWLCHLTVH
jgi:hypothetical protein